MVYLGLKPGAAGWKVQTNPLSYGGTPFITIKYTNAHKTGGSTGLVVMEGRGFESRHRILNAHDIFSH